MTRLKRFPKVEDKIRYMEWFIKEPWEEILSLIKISFRA